GGSDARAGEPGGFPRRAGWRARTLAQDQRPVPRLDKRRAPRVRGARRQLCFGALARRRAYFRPDFCRRTGRARLENDMSVKKRGLGRGLDALLGSVSPTPAEAGEELREIALDALLPGKHQPRRAFDSEALGAL